MPKPVLQAMVLADQVYQDRISGKHIIAGTFTTIGYFEKVNTPDLPSGPTVAQVPVTSVGSPYLYLALTAVHDVVALVLKYVDLSNAEVLMKARFQIQSSDPVAVTEFVIPIPRLPANHPGHYSLDLLYEDEILGSWRVNVMRIEETDK